MIYIYIVTALLYSFLAQLPLLQMLTPANDRSDRSLSLTFELHSDRHQSKHYQLFPSIRISTIVSE